MFDIDEDLDEDKCLRVGKLDCAPNTAMECLGMVIRPVILVELADHVKTNTDNPESFVIRNDSSEAFSELFFNAKNVVHCHLLKTFVETISHLLQLHE